MEVSATSKHKEEPLPLRDFKRSHPTFAPNPLLPTTQGERFHEEVMLELYGTQLIKLEVVFYILVVTSSQTQSLLDCGIFGIQIDPLT